MSYINNNTKNRYLAMLLCSIFSEQTVISSIFHNLSVILRDYSTIFTVFFYIIVLFSTIAQSKLSDEYGRKKHLLIASYMVMLSGILIFWLIFTKNYISQETLVLLSAIYILPLAVGGNFIPISRGCIASLDIDNFRSAIGYTTSMIGFGWITVDMMSYIFLPLQLMLITLLMQFVCTMMIIKYYKQKDGVRNDKKPIVVITNSYKDVIRTIILTGGLSLVLTYFFTEAVFYNIYVEDELNALPLYKKLAGISMGIAYFLGIVTQFIINPSDDKSIKFGLTLSFASSLIILCLKNSLIVKVVIPIESFINLKIQDILQGCFSFGFGYFVPSLFSVMSKKVNKNNYGWLFGLLDATDTAALLLSSVFVYLISTQTINNFTFGVLNVLIFSIALIISFRFLIKRRRNST